MERIKGERTEDTGEEERKVPREQVKKNGKKKKRRKKWKKIKKGAVGALTLLVACATAWIACMDYQRQKDFDSYSRNKDAEEARENSLEEIPRFQAEWKEKVAFGMKDYYRIFLKNVNDGSAIASGIFQVGFMVTIEGEEGVISTYIWDDKIKDSEILYSEMLGGGLILLEDNYRECVEQVQNIGEKLGREDISYCPYVFWGFRNTGSGQQDFDYFLLEVTEDKSESAVAEYVLHPDMYKEGYKMTGN